MVSPKDKVITDVKQLEGKTLIVTKGTTAETYFEKNHSRSKTSKIWPIQRCLSSSPRWTWRCFSTDNTEVLAWALENKGYEVGITSLGDPDTIAPAVQKETKNSSISLTMTFKSWKRKLLPQSLRENSSPNIWRCSTSRWPRCWRWRSEITNKDSIAMIDAFFLV